MKQQSLKKPGGNITLPSYPVWCRLLDHLLQPAMIVLAGFRMGDIQHTHPWHASTVPADAIDLEKAVKTHGHDSSRFTSVRLFLFHAPVLGGWKDYSVYEAPVPHFHVGWIMYDADSGKLAQSVIHRLPVRGAQVRLLDGTPNRCGWFFAVNDQGEQIPLCKVDAGRLGDGRYQDVDLF